MTGSDDGQQGTRWSIGPAGPKLERAGQPDPGAVAAVGGHQDARPCWIPDLGLMAAQSQRAQRGPDRSGRRRGRAPPRLSRRIAVRWIESSVEAAIPVKSRRPTGIALATLAVTLAALDSPGPSEICAPTLAGDPGLAATVCRTPVQVTCGTETDGQRAPRWSGPPATASRLMYRGRRDGVSWSATATPVCPVPRAGPRLVHLPGTPGMGSSGVAIPTIGGFRGLRTIGHAADEEPDGWYPSTAMDHSSTGCADDAMPCLAGVGDRGPAHRPGSLADPEPRARRGIERGGWPADEGVVRVVRQGQVIGVLRFLEETRAAAARLGSPVLRAEARPRLSEVTLAATRTAPP